MISSIKCYVEYREEKKDFLLVKNYQEKLTMHIIYFFEEKYIYVCTIFFFILFFLLYIVINFITHKMLIRFYFKTFF